MLLPTDVCQFCGAPSATRFHWMWECPALAPQRDPEIMAAMQNPKMMQVFMEMQTQGPMAIMKYQNDPEVMNLIMKIQGAMGGGGAGMGAMGGMGGGMP